MPDHQKDKRTLRVASVQFESLPGDKHAYFRKIETFVEQAADQGVQLIVFPERCITGYWFIRNLSIAQLTALAEPIPDGPSTRRLIDLARQYRITLGAGLVEAAGSGVFHNSYVVALPGGTIHCHRKLHAFEHTAIRNGTDYTLFDLPESRPAYEDLHTGWRNEFPIELPTWTELA